MTIKIKHLWFLVLGFQILEFIAIAIGLSGKPNVDGIAIALAATGTALLLTPDKLRKTG